MEDYGVEKGVSPQGPTCKSIELILRSNLMERENKNGNIKI
jgi:hypothetical protein